MHLAFSQPARAVFSGMRHTKPNDAEIAEAREKALEMISAAMQRDDHAARKFLSSILDAIRAFEPRSQEIWHHGISIESNDLPSAVALGGLTALLRDYQKGLVALAQIAEEMLKQHNVRLRQRDLDSMQGSEGWTSDGSGAQRKAAEILAQHLDQGVQRLLKVWGFYKDSVVSIREHLDSKWKAIAITCSTETNIDDRRQFVRQLNLRLRDALMKDILTRWMFEMQMSNSLRKRLGLATIHSPGAGHFDSFRTAAYLESTTDTSRSDSGRQLIDQIFSDERLMARMFAEASTMFATVSDSSSIVPAERVFRAIAVQEGGQPENSANEPVDMDLSCGVITISETLFVLASRAELA